mgnify:CR=1 FL=1
MPVDLDKTRALLASVEGFTPGPWVHDEGVDPHFDRFFARAASVDTAPDERGGADHIALVHGYEGPNGRLLAAAPDLHRELTEAVGEIERLRAHNARMVALLSKIADAMDAADREPTWSDRMIVVTDSLPDATDLRRLAAGEVDDG